MSDDDVLDVRGACKLLRLGKNAIYDACGRGELPHRRIGNRIRFSKAALLRWLGAANDPTMIGTGLSAIDEEALHSRAREHAERMKGARVRR